jgi:Arc/MetJ-type ribon-helix-helix transcriptional regulator
MTINISKDVESTINVAVQSGQFASAAEMVTKLVREYEKRTQQPAVQQQPAEPSKPIWEIIEEENRSIPSEVWDDLPTDLAAYSRSMVHEICSESYAMPPDGRVTQSREAAGIYGCALGSSTVNPSARAAVLSSPSDEMKVRALRPAADLP